MSVSLEKASLYMPFSFSLETFMYFFLLLEFWNVCRNIPLQIAGENGPHLEVNWSTAPVSVIQTVNQLQACVRRGNLPGKAASIRPRTILWKSGHLWALRSQCWLQLRHGCKVKWQHRGKVKQFKILGKTKSCKKTENNRSKCDPNCGIVVQFWTINITYISFDFDT